MHSFQRKSTLENPSKTVQLDTKDSLHYVESLLPLQAMDLLSHLDSQSQKLNQIVQQSRQKGLFLQLLLTEQKKWLIAKKEAFDIEKKLLLLKINNIQQEQEKNEYLLLKESCENRIIIKSEKLSISQEILKKLTNHLQQWSELTKELDQEDYNIPRFLSIFLLILLCLVPFYLPDFIMSLYSKEIKEPY